MICKLDHELYDKNKRFINDFICRKERRKVSYIVLHIKANQNSVDLSLA